MSTATQTRTDVYEKITNQIVALLEKGVRPWMRPWGDCQSGKCVSRPLRSNGEPYRGINVLALWTSAVDNGYNSPFWFTFKQVAEMGGHVRKGERGTFVVYANSFTKTEVDDNGEEKSRNIPFLREYYVFNADQCERLPARFQIISEAVQMPAKNRIEQADRFFAATKADVRAGGNSAHYCPETDHVQMPHFDDFHSAESHAATLAHELIHWTGHASRLGRELSEDCRSSSYAFEELIAELCATFLCADLRIEPEVREDHASYIQSWIRALKDDKRMIFRAASAATAAVDFLHGLQS